MAASYNFELNIFGVADNLQQIHGSFLCPNHAITFAKYDKYLAVEKLASIA